jgi:outer membrane receptor for ferrienterochelin and colicin
VDSAWVDPRFTARWEVSPRAALSAGVGRYSQPPALAEIAEPFGNPVGLEPEHAIQTSVGAVVRPTDYLSIEPTVFYNDLDDLVGSTDAVTVLDGESVPLRYDNGGIGRSYGAELLVRHDLNRNLSGWVSYTLSRAERQMSGESEMRLFENDQTHIFQALAAYRLPARFEVSSRVRAVTGNPTTPVVDSVFVSDQDEFAPIPGEYDSVRLPAFFQLDVRVSRTWLFRTWQLETYLDVQNATNRRNTEEIAYSYDYSEKGPATGLPILPALGVKAEW